MCLCVARACRHHLSSVHPYRVGVQSEPGCSSPFYLPTCCCSNRSAGSERGSVRSSGGRRTWLWSGRDDHVHDNRKVTAQVTGPMYVCRKMNNSQARTGHQRGMGGRETDDDDTRERHRHTQAHKTLSQLGCHTARVSVRQYLFAVAVEYGGGGCAGCLWAREQCACVRLAVVS